MPGNWFNAWLPVEKIQNGSGHPESIPLIRLQSIVKSYTSAAGTFQALKGIDLHIAAGEFVAITGKSGSGKSTLINIITGIDRPTSGEIFVGGMGLHRLNEDQMALWRGKNVGVVFQFFQLLPSLTLLENVVLPMRLCHQYKPHERWQRAAHLLEQVGLADHRHKRPSAVSGGQQQRAALARALANDPPIVVADEPTGNLDSRTSEVVFQLFKDLVARGKTILIVTHDQELSRQTERSIVIADGAILSDEHNAHTTPVRDESTAASLELAWS